MFVSGGDAVGEVSHAGEEVNAKPRSGGWQGLIRPFRAVVHGGAVPRPLAWAGAEARRWRWQTRAGAALAATPLGFAGSARRRRRWQGGRGLAPKDRLAIMAAPGPPAPKARFNASPGQRPGNGFRYHPRPEKGESNPATFRRRALRSPPHRHMPPLPHRHWRQTNCPCPKQIVAERPRK